MSPAQTLPADILITIFHLNSEAQTNIGLLHGHIWDLLQVCAHWRNVVIENKSLWGSCILGDKVEISPNALILRVELLAENSRLPLEMALMKQLDDCRDLAFFRNFLSATSNYPIHRLNLSTSMLPDTTPIFTSPHILSSICHLSLIDRMIPKNFTLPPNHIKSLLIQGSNETLHIPQKRIYSLLCVLPDLEELTWSKVRIEDIPPRCDIPAITLPHLHTLRVEVWARDPTDAAIFQVLRVPSLHTLQLHWMKGATSSRYHRLDREAVFISPLFYMLKKSQCMIKNLQIVSPDQLKSFTGFHQNESFKDVERVGVSDIRNIEHILPIFNSRSVLPKLRKLEIGVCYGIYQQPVTLIQNIIHSRSQGVNFDCAALQQIKMTMILMQSQLRNDGFGWATEYFDGPFSALREYGRRLGVHVDTEVVSRVEFIGKR